MTSAIRNLTERRLPQVLAIYLGAAFGVVQFVDFVGSRYLLPAVWTDLTLLAMALLLPSVLLYTYHHGRPGRDEWQRSEKIFIPVNLAVLFALVGFVGAGAPLTPTSKRITVTDEQGNQREAVVPNKAYRKRVAMFMFDAPADTSVQWLQFGLPQLAIEDLTQSQFIETVASVSMRAGLQRYGFANGVNVPLSAKRDIANEMHIPHFVAGRIEKTGNEYAATVQVYETESAKLVKERTYRGADPIKLADEMSAGLLKDLNVPVLSDAKPDMPVSEILSTNPAAVRAYLEACEALMLKFDWQTAGAEMTRAVQLDGTFASAHFMNFLVARLANQPAAAQVAVKAALDNSYRLPDRMKEIVKANYYVAKEDWRKAYAVLDMLTQLYPEDIQVQQMLLELNTMRDNKDGQIAAFQKILEFDPSRGELLLNIGQVYEQKGDTKNALKFYEDYAKKYPNDVRGSRSLGVLHRRLGEHAKARAAFERALLVKPEDLETTLGLAKLSYVTGDFADAVTRYDEAAAVARSPEERIQVLLSRIAFDQFRGDLKAFMGATRAALTEVSKILPPLMVLQHRLSWTSMLVTIDPAAAQRSLNELKTQANTPPASYFLPLAEAPVYIAFNDVQNAEAAVARLETVMKQNDWKFLGPEVAKHRGALLESLGKCEEAITWYREAAKADATTSEFSMMIGRCLRKLNRIKEAEAELMKTLRILPTHGETNLELGLLYKDAGDAAKARTHLQRALLTWAKADANFKPARSAREALSALK